MALQWTTLGKIDTPTHPTQSVMTPGSPERIKQDTAGVIKALLGIRQAGQEPHWEAGPAHQTKSSLQTCSARSSEQSPVGQGSSWTPHSRSNHGREG